MPVRLTYLIIECCILFSQNIVAQSLNFSPEMFGAKADAVVIKDANIDSASAILIASSSLFFSGDTGKIIFVNGAASSGATLISTVKTVINKNEIILNNTASQSVTNATVTYGTDCTNAFIEMNISARKKSKVFISFSKGIYLTGYNNWLAGIKNVEVEGNNASVMCTNGAYNPDGFAAANVALYMPSVFDNVDNNYYSNKWASATSYGFKIKTVRALDNKITLLQSDSAVNFKAGDWTLIYGFEQENTGGFPPDVRYFEFIKIKSINASGGKITFQTPLKHNYSSGWPDNTWTNGNGGIGAARIINCNRSSFNIIDTLIIKDLNFVSFPGWKSRLSNPERNGRVQLYGVIYGRITNVTSTALYAGTAKNVCFEKSTISAAAEPDKEVENLTFQNCTIHKMISARGIDTLKLFNSNFTGEFTVSPRVVLIDSCNFSTTASGSTTALAHIGFNGGTDWIQLGANTWNCFDVKRKYLLGPGGTTNLRVEKVADKNTILVSNANWSDARNGRQVVPQHTGRTANGKSCTVQKIYQYQKGIIAVEGNFSSPPEEGDVFVFSFLPNVIIKDEQVMNGLYKKNYSVFANEKNIDDLKQLNK